MPGVILMQKGTFEKVLRVQPGNHRLLPKRVSGSPSGGSEPAPAGSGAHFYVPLQEQTREAIHWKSGSLAPSLAAGRVAYCVHPVSKAA